MKLSNLDFKKVFHYVIISNRTLEKILLKIKILITLEKTIMFMTLNTSLQGGLTLKIFKIRGRGG
jgi:hypothetical protein